MCEKAFRLKVRWPDGHVSTPFESDDWFRVRSEWLKRPGLQDHEAWIEDRFGSVVERF